jgi:hypothetical protein
MKNKSLYCCRIRGEVEGRKGGSEGEKEAVRGKKRQWGGERGSEGEKEAVRG